MIKDRQEYNAYMRNHLKKKYHQRITEAKETLGNQCKLCGSQEDLEFDHINPESKIDCLTTLTGSKDKFYEELEKCQLLCKECHKVKTLNDKDQQSAKLIHGTLSSYRYCKCELCKKAKSDHSKRYYIKNKGL